MGFDKSKFNNIFKAELKERLGQLNLGLIKLEKNPEDKKLQEAMMRHAHTIKGSAVLMGYKRIADIAHRMEDGLESVFSGNFKLERQHIDILLKSVDAITLLVDDKVTWQDKGIERPFVDDLCAELEAQFGKKEAEQKQKTPAVEKAAVPVQAGIGDIAEESIRVQTDKLDKLVNLSGELYISKMGLNEVLDDFSNKVEGHPKLNEILNQTIKKFDDINENITNLIYSLQDEVLHVRMVPVANLFNLFPRAMRDLAGESKSIDFQIKGEETQLDKNIIDGMKDPIMHLLRNAVDHGIENSQERKEKTKPSDGKITLAAFREGAQVVIQISDDGRGIDIEKVKQQAVKCGIVTSKRIEDFSDEQVLQLIFTAGFSTKEDVSETSGRGVGLDVVRESIARLKGMVEVKSEIDKGTVFTMRFPLTLATTDTLIITVGNELFAVPIESVIQTVRIKLEDIKKVETKEAITLQGQIIPIVRLNEIFGLSRKGIVEKQYFPVVIIQSVEKKMGLLVDELNGRQVVVTKAIGDPLKNLKNIAGATILGTGKVILILDVPSIIDSAETGIIKRPARPTTTVADKGRKRKTILLAEDMLSTAMLEKNILESVGYSVVIARDGQEALERALEESFDMVISDVLMPRMNGFELVAKLRQEPAYKDIPILIVTTRESEQDKRRGLEVGADAYILKSEFTSEKLLDTLERLIG